MAAYSSFTILRQNVTHNFVSFRRNRKMGLPAGASTSVRAGEEAYEEVQKPRIASRGRNRKQDPLVAQQEQFSVVGFVEADFHTVYKETACRAEFLFNHYENRYRAVNEVAKAMKDYMLSHPDDAYDMAQLTPRAVAAVYSRENGVEPQWNWLPSEDDIATQLEDEADAKAIAEAEVRRLEEEERQRKEEEEVESGVRLHLIEKLFSKMDDDIPEDDVTEDSAEIL